MNYKAGFTPVAILIAILGIAIAGFVTYKVEKSSPANINLEHVDNNGQKKNSLTDDNQNNIISGVGNPTQKFTAMKAGGGAGINSTIIFTYKDPIKGSNYVVDFGDGNFSNMVYKDSDKTPPPSICSGCKWTPPPSDYEIAHTYEAPGTYTTKLKIQNLSLAIAEVKVTIASSPEVIDLTIPGTFTLEVGQVAKTNTNFLFILTGIDQALHYANVGWRYYSGGCGVLGCSSSTIWGVGSSYTSFLDPNATNTQSSAKSLMITDGMTIKLISMSQTSATFEISR